MSNPYENLTDGFSEGMRARVEQYVRTGDTTPYRADLDLTTACNYRCAHCGDAAQGLLNHGGLRWEEIEPVLDDLADLGVTEVCLIGGGEPMLSPHFEATLEGLARRGIECGVTTNGSRITPDAIPALAKWATWVRVSVDAATEATYRLVHRPQDGTGLEGIHAALRALARAIPGRVGVGFLILEGNVGEIVEAAAQARELGVGHIRYRFANHPLTGHILPVGNPEEVHQALDRARLLEDDTFAVSIAEASLSTLDAAATEQPKVYTTCHAQAFSATVTGTGEVYVCSKWRGKPWACLGNIRHQRLTDIWHGKHRRQLVEALDPCETCSAVYCHGHAHNQFLDLARSARQAP